MNKKKQLMNSLTLSHLICFIIQPTRTTFHSNSINDNIFFNYISVNVTSAISDHLPDFIITPKIFSNAPNKKCNFFERDLSKFNREEFILDYFPIDFKRLVKV